MSNNTKKLFSLSEKQQIVTVIKRVEKATSAELRVHIDSVCKGEVLDEAVRVFNKLGMQKTALRNGVLIYVAFESRKSAIIGDESINASVNHEFWNECHNAMKNHFAKEDYVGGICEALKMLERELKEHFPYQADDVNELSDEISIGK